MQSEDFINGQLLLIDKPLGWTSFDAVNKIRYAIRKTFHLKKIKVGHAGTLDPLATGLLLICTGRSTKGINELMGLTKEYTGSITLGATTPSYDLETEINETFPTDHISDELIADVLPRFIGDVEQVPPLFSAIKKEGERAYELARKGKDVKLKSRKVRIESFEITLREGNLLHFKVVCGKGTYIRSLAYDFGKALGSRAHLSALRRTAIGSHRVEDARDPIKFTESLAANQ